jgi:hypothetical protein
VNWVSFPRKFKIAYALAFALAILSTTLAAAQTYTVIHNLTGGAAGANQNFAYIARPGK